MIAKPIIPGRLYSVKVAGQTFTVIAAHPCDAISIVIGVIA